MNPRTCLAMLVLAAVNSGVLLFQPAPAADDEPQFTPNRVFVSSAGTQSILEITLRDLPNPVTALPAPPPSVTGLDLPEFVTGLLLPEDLLFGPGGLLYSTDRDTDLVTSYDAEGMPLATFGLGTGLEEPSGLAFGPLGDLFVSSFGTDEIYIFDVLGEAPPGDGGPPTISDPALDGPAGLAFAPFMMSLNLSGRLSARDQAESKAKSSGTLTVAPGSGVMMMLIDDPDPEKPDPVISAFGTPAMVFHGYEVFTDDESSNRVFHGAMTPDDARGAGVGTLLLELKGQLDESEFGPKSGSGYLQRAGEGGVLDAKVKVKAPKQKKK